MALAVYDHNRFSKDKHLGEADVEVCKPPFHQQATFFLTFVGYSFGDIYS